MFAVHSLSTRFIYPFFYTQDTAVETIIPALKALQYGEKAVWQSVEKTKEFYTQEMLNGIKEFIFFEQTASNSTDSERPPTRYLTLNSQLADQWFGKEINVTFGKNKEGLPKESFRAKLSTQAEIEIFLLPQGVGVLSIPFATVEVDDEAALKRFNYRLSQHLAAKIPKLSLPHHDHPKAPAAPAEDSPFFERLGKRGGQFTLVELRDFLLSPLKLFGLNKMQEQFSVYSVVRFANTDFTDTTVQKELFPLLVGLAHVEEPHHAGSLEISQQLLNRCHWSAVGTLGAVHLVVDQADDIDFNEQRVITVLNKYFLPYLLALSQRLIFQHILKRAQQNPNDLQSSHDDMLSFMLNGYLSEVSSREVINQYYLLVKKGLRVETSFEILRRALHDADFNQDVKFQRQSSSEREYSLKQMIDMTVMQHKIEWLEVFFASYYAGALAHYVGYGLFKPDFVSWSTFGWAVAVGALVFWGLKPWKDDHDEQPRRVFIWVSIASLILAIVIWFIVGFECFPK